MNSRRDETVPFGMIRIFISTVRISNFGVSRTTKLELKFVIRGACYW